jgi:hypothetical protein
MRLDYVVTFEFETTPPITVRGKTEAHEVQKCGWRALKEAKDKVPNVAWSSLVLVLTREGLLQSRPPQD